MGGAGSAGRQKNEIDYEDKLESGRERVGRGGLVGLYISAAQGIRVINFIQALAS